jgi:ParB-like chromosome segregation protein Spo0J
MQHLWPANSVKNVPIEGLVPYARNARLHSPAQIAQIAASIKEWGWTIPILIGDDEGIIAGHGRILAARQLGITEVPVMVATGWSDAKKRAYVIADNRLAENASWDRDMLGAELSDLAAACFAVELTGFTMTDMAALLSTPTDPDKEWSGMPEFDQDDLGGRTITVHFENDDDVADFAQLIGQEIGPKTTYVWHPRRPYQRTGNKRYVATAAGDAG